MFNRIFKARRVYCKFWGSLCSCIQDYVASLAGHLEIGLVERDLLSKSFEKMQSFLQIMKKTSPKNRPFTKSWVWGYTKSHSQVCCSNVQGMQHAESVEKQNGGKMLVCSLRTNHGLTLRQA
jgi:hypothetical protein